MRHFETVKTTDLCDEFPESVEVCAPAFRSFGGKRDFHGSIATVRVHEDNVLVREALETLPPGTVLVVDGGASTECALLGDQLAEIAVRRGLAGVIVNGCVRDSRELADLNLGVLALASHPRKSRKNGEGEVDVTLNFWDAEWRPGDYLYADADGVVVSTENLLKT